MPYKLLTTICTLWLTSASWLTVQSQVIQYDTKISINKNGEKSTTKTILLQINSKEENWLSHVEIKHNPQQEFSLNLARILDKDGTQLRKLKKNESVTRNDISYQSFFQDNLITEFDLFWNQYPYRVEYSYTITEKEFLYVAWWASLLYTNVPALHSSLEIEIPIDYSVKILAEDNLDHKETTSKDVRTLFWQSAVQKRLNKETYSPTLLSLVPKVKVIPQSFNYGVTGSTESWSSFGNWLTELNKGTDDLTIQEKLAIDNLVSEKGNEIEKIKAIYQYLQEHTTYVNVAIDKGGLKSYPASYVCEKKYGDCKALTTYMKALLKHAGIESIYTIINAGTNKESINSSYPSQQFNHVILMIPNGKDTLWLENTSSSMPFNYLGTFSQNRLALTVNGPNSQLVKTPKLEINDVLQERVYEIELLEENKVKIDIDLILRGKEFEEFRYLLSQKNDDAQKEQLKENFQLNDFEMKDWTTTNFHKDSTFLQIYVSGNSSAFIRKIGNIRAINPLKIEIPEIEKPEERKLDFKVNYPISKSDKSRYNLKALEKPTIQLPEGIAIESEYGVYKSQFQQNESDITIYEEFTLFDQRISIEEYQNFYKFIESIKNYKKKTAIIIK